MPGCALSPNMLLPFQEGSTTEFSFSNVMQVIFGGSFLNGFFPNTKACLWLRPTENHAKIDI